MAIDSSVDAYLLAMILFVVYTYVGYPCLLYLFSIVRCRPVRKDCGRKLATVSVVIAARNEEQTIEKRLRNLLDQDYDRDKMEIIVVSDGSVDGTCAAVEKIKRDLGSDQAGGRVSCLSYQSSRGKPAALNTGVGAAVGELVVFTDCRQRFSRDAIRQLVANFADPKVGCVSGELLFEQAEGASLEAEMGAYWHFEKRIRKLESRTGSVPGATGAIYAIRRTLYRQIPEQTLLDDVLIPLQVAGQGFRVTFDSQALAFDSVSKDFSQERKRKVRTLAGNWQLLWLKPSLLNPFMNPLWAKFISHKVFRLLVPHVFLLLVLTSVFHRDWLSQIILTVSALGLLLAALPSPSSRFRLTSSVSRICKTMVALNYFAFIAPFKLIRSSRGLW